MGDQHVVVLGIARAGQQPFVVRQLVQRRRVVIDNHDAMTVLPQHFHHRAAQSAVAADNRVVLNGFQGTLHATPPLGIFPAAVGKELRRCAKRVAQRADAAENQHNRQHASRDGQRLHFTVANRRQRDDRHVERVKERPPLQHVVAKRADQQQQDGD